jgi:aerobic-type carbon monoxide dehydrogenase small subunit (CoxS/CutS family)
MERDAIATLKFTVNGVPRTVETVPDRPLLDVLREELELTGAKYGCGEGQCGACSVLLDGKRIFSCRTPASRADGKALRTIEGLANGETLHPVQQAFLEEGAFQCGYCTPGMIMAAVGLLEANAKPTDAEIAEGMNRNLCRCCSYSKIQSAVSRAAGRGGR